MDKEALVYAPHSNTTKPGSRTRSASPHQNGATPEGMVNSMRFETRYDCSIVVILSVVALLVGVVLPALRILAPRDHPAPLWLAFMPLAVCLIIVCSALPQYYEIRQNGLFLRIGWRRVLIPFDSLAEVRCNSDTRGFGIAFSSDRMLVATKEGDRFLIAVADEGRFLAELSKRCQHLKQQPFALHIPLSPPSVV
jgi:hypothetical protein